MVKMKKMKRISAVMAALALSMSAMAVSASAEEAAATDTASTTDTAAATDTTAASDTASTEDTTTGDTADTTVTTPDPVNVYVTISNRDLMLIQEEVEVKDIDNDGALTINDALYAAHEDGFEGGAAAGYASSLTQYGLSLSKLWGVENGGSYGYYVNSVSAWSLTDAVKEGDYVDAFVYTDTTAWSDAYSFFDKRTGEIDLDKENTVELTLSYAGFDESYNSVTLPVKGAVITINGSPTEFVTDDEGKVTITIEDAGEYRISATSETQTLVPPIFMLSADKTEAPEETQQPEETTDNTPEQTQKPEEKTQEQKPTETSNPKTASCGSIALGFVSLGLAGVLASKRRNK